LCLCYDDVDNDDEDDEGLLSADIWYICKREGRDEYIQTEYVNVK